MVRIEKLRKSTEIEFYDFVVVAAAAAAIVVVEEFA